jgi:hypothetical protein
MARAKTLIERHIEALKALKGRSVEAGWFETNCYKPGKKPNGEDISEKLVGQPVAKIARIQEFGCTIKRGKKTIVIPARPFMRLAHSNFGKKRSGIQKKIARQLIRGEIKPEQALGQIGLALEGCIVDSIKNGGWEPNAESTVKNKGFDKPLIDSAQMWQGVTSKVSST